MVAEPLPLLDLFTQLREAGLPLGIGEYQWVLKAWQAGYGTQDRAALARLCCTVWVKTPEEAQIFEVQFNRLIRELPTSTPQNTTAKPHPGPSRLIQAVALGIFGGSSLILGTCWWMLRPQPSVELRPLALALPLVNESTTELYEATQPIVEAAATDAAEDFEDNLQAQEDIPTAISTEVLLPPPWWQQYGLRLWGGLWLTSGAVWGWFQWRSSRQRQVTDQPDVTAGMSLAVTQHMQDEVQVVRLGQTVMTADYLPVTRRQMKQSWRHLRRMVRSGPPTELDVEATVQVVGRQGLLLTPVFRARRINLAEVLLLVDYGGSMVPFHALAQRLVDIVQYGDRQTQACIYYFHNCPVTWLYRDPYQQSAATIDQVLQSLTSDYAGALILSDGGAAHGRWYPHRLELTEQFLTRLHQRLRYVTWLNPMPQKRWAGTTAGAIAQRVPMFEFDRVGLDAAISVLRGQGRAGL
ncbi:hypothetical protein PN498_23940 [Oscillatoria sp. CS-180]|uniref:VWA domain-containing protein n=1 Tax=Oscillatoria sp. CS-180 TaxID=3021720 RepID=UPI00232B26F8|nr:VWA domain-containing protein [Oscillatoria sp. CS-180]MDB9529066.1 hypothetical protein [Oscillatoria sp. CS-180]